MKNPHPILIASLALVCAIAFLSSVVALLAQDAPQKSSDKVYQGQGKGMTLPKVVHQVEPEYADRPRKKKIQGTVTMSIVVTAEGNVRDAEVTTSLDKDLDQKALECVRKWKFDPATKDGQPVAMHIAIEMNFHLY
jgi:TonB family protein